MKQKSFIVGAAAFWVVMCTNYFIKLDCTSKTWLSYCEMTMKDLQTVCKMLRNAASDDESCEAITVLKMTVSSHAWSTWTVFRGLLLLTLSTRARTPSTKVHKAVFSWRGRYHTNLLTHGGDSRGCVTVTSHPLQNNSVQNLKCHSDVVHDRKHSV